MEKLNFLPGPVKFHPDIFKDLAANPLSHRTEEFKQIFDDTCTMLSQLVRVKHTALLMGSGTLANEVIAGQLSVLGGKGLIISNGEFGERLAQQAKRFNLNFHHLSYTWGESFDYMQTENYILNNRPSWVWFVHLETSTGILNDLPRIISVCKKTNTKICTDCMSSIGNMPLNLEDVYLAAASSGKGLSGFNGIALVFSNHIPSVCERLPKYLDLGYYYLKNKVPFTFSYNLLFALYGELKRTCFEKRYREIANIGKHFTALLENYSIDTLGNSSNRVNFIFTLVFKEKGASVRFGDFCAAHNIGVHYKNDYLKARNWVQIVFMGHHSFESSKVLFDIIPLWHKINKEDRVLQIV